MPHDAPLLLPSPASLKLTGGVVDVTATADTTRRHDPAAKVSPGGYRLTIGAGAGPGNAEIVVSSESGLRNARATLRQLLRQYGRRVPCLEITDAPAFATRGVMLDISRDRVPTPPALRDAATLFASLKLNHLELYTEHTFAYEGHEDVWRNSGAITQTEAQELDDHAKRLGIDLVPNQNCFGHLHRWLNMPRYAPLAETHGEWWFMRWLKTGPFSLCPIDPASEAFVRELLGQLLPCFSSGLVNIGCDETFDVGQGRSAAEVESRGEGGKAAVYFEFVEKVCAIARQMGKRPMMWADIALSTPESLHLFPKDAVGLAWGYEPDFDFGEACRRLAQHGVESWVCPGTSAWLSITGRTTERRGNIAQAAAAKKDGATGFLMTDWGDYGHMQQWPVTLRGIADAAQAAWNPGAEADPRAVSLHALGDTSESLGLAAWMDELGDADIEIRRVAGMTAEGKPPSGPIRNNSALFLDLHRPWPYVHPVGATREQWQGILDHLTALESSMPSQKDVLLSRELTQTVRHAKLAAMHAVVERGEKGRAAEMVELAHAVAAEHASLWTERNRGGGLDRSAARFELLTDRLVREFGAPSGALAR
jgi:hexosaminidase